MRIFLDAYFDNNFGDDLFIEILLKRYPQALFYAFLKEVPGKVLKRAAQFPNLVLLPGGCIMQESWEFDGFVMIGGDVLPDGVDYSERISRMRHVKESGGYVAMLGFSLYKDYSAETLEDLRKMAELADTIVIRDKASAERFKELVSRDKVMEATDMVFTLKYQPVQEEAKGPLGVIPRRKLYSTKEEHQAYCKAMAKVADAYLQSTLQGSVRFLAFSTGEYDDRETARDIMELMEEKGRVQVVAYEGDTEGFWRAVSTCGSLLTTRFHGLVLALCLRIPFVPVPYEVKVTQLLDELEYEGIRIPYGGEITQEQAQRAVEELRRFGVSLQMLGLYEQKAERFFAAWDEWYYAQKKRNANEGFFEKLAKVTETKKTIEEENKQLKKQQAELEKWIASLKEERVGFEAQNAELNKLYSELNKLYIQQQEQIGRIPGLENENTMLKKQVDELMKWIDSLKQERAAFERQNLELENIRVWYKEKLERKTINTKKLTEEYDSFLRQLRKQLDK